MGQREPGGGATPRWLLNGAAVLILGVWGLAVTVDIFSTSFEAPVGLYGIATVVAGALFGVQLVRK